MEVENLGSSSTIANNSRSSGRPWKKSIKGYSTQKVLAKMKEDTEEIINSFITTAKKFGSHFFVLFSLRTCGR